VTLVRSDLFETLRGFDPLITVLGEDLDLCWRAQVAGARIVVAPSAKVAHRETIANGGRPVAIHGMRRTSRQDLQRRHQLLVVATGWGGRTSAATLPLLAVMDAVEFFLALIGGDTDRAGAILGSWRWLLKNRKSARRRRVQLHATRVLSDEELRRLQVGGASRLKRFVVTLLREGLDRARGILPASEDQPKVEVDEGEDAGVGFAAAFYENEEFDEIPESAAIELRRQPMRLLTTFRSQIAVMLAVIILWSIATRNLVATHLPLVGRLAPLDSWWTTWRHFFASWSPNGLGTGTPGMPGYGLVAFAGTFVFGRMGILPRVVLIAAVPLGAIAVGRLLRGRVSNRARVVAAISYMALPLGLNMIGQGRVDVLVVVTGLPLVVRRLFELLAVPGFRSGPYPDPVPFGHRGWRATRSGQRMLLVVLVAVLTSLAPATLVLVAIVVVGVMASRFFEPDELGEKVRPWRLLCAIVVSVAIFLLPMTVDTLLAGRRAPELFGLAVGPWSAPSFLDLLRGADGSFGSTWLGWLLPLAALLGLLLCRGERRAIAVKAATIATLTLVVAALDARHWMGSFAPDIEVLLALYVVMLALLIGLGVSALEHDLRQAGFGWRQIFGAVTVVALLVAVLPFLASMAGGRFDLPTTSVAESLNALAPTDAGGYRVLWLGDPSILPIAGWSVAPGLAAATSMNGLPSGATLIAPPDSGTSDVLLNDVKLALEGKTVRLGELLAPEGISTIVVMSAAAPEISGVQSVPLHPVPASLTTALGRQTDLSLELHTDSVEVFSNSLFHGLVAQTSPSGLLPAIGGAGIVGPVYSGSVVESGLAPASAFTLDVDGKAARRQTFDGWAPSYQVGTYSATPTAKLVLHRLPLNGLLALFTLVLWATVWLGFGWVQRFEWLFTSRARRSAARHAKRGHE
jgi:hypothetical protein